MGGRGGPRLGGGGGAGGCDEQGEYQDGADAVEFSDQTSSPLEVIERGEFLFQKSSIATPGEILGGATLHRLSGGPLKTHAWVTLQCSRSSVCNGDLPDSQSYFGRVILRVRRCDGQPLVVSVAAHAGFGELGWVEEGSLGFSALN